MSNIAPQVGDGFNRHCECVCVYESAHNLIFVSDWAYLEDWCRRLTGKFQDVYVFTVPLYLPKRDPDGKWRVVCRTSALARRRWSLLLSYLLDT